MQVSIIVARKPTNSDGDIGREYYRMNSFVCQIFIYQTFGRLIALTGLPTYVQKMASAGMPGLRSPLSLGRRTLTA